VKDEQPKSQTKQRRRYDEKFKRNAVELLERGERSAVQLGRELGDVASKMWTGIREVFVPKGLLDSARGFNPGNRSKNMSRPACPP